MKMYYVHLGEYTKTF